MPPLPKHVSLGQFGHRVQVVVSRQRLIPVDTSTVRHCRQKSFW